MAVGSCPGPVPPDAGSEGAVTHPALPSRPGGFSGGVPQAEAPEDLDDTDSELPKEAQSAAQFEPSAAHKTTKRGENKSIKQDLEDLLESTYIPAVLKILAKYSDYLNTAIITFLKETRFQLYANLPDRAG